jgi:hypothetical protein
VHAPLSVAHRLRAGKDLKPQVNPAAVETTFRFYQGGGEHYDNVGCCCAHD